MTDKDNRSHASPSEPLPEVRDQNSRPWRTEGVPKEQPPKRRPKWTMLVVWVLGYVLFFGVLTVQDRMSSPATVPYTKFKSQVTNKNVAEVFARGNTIEGTLRKEVPLPGQPTDRSGQVRKYQKFTTHTESVDAFAPAVRRSRPPTGHSSQTCSGTTYGVR